VLAGAVSSAAFEIRKLFDLKQGKNALYSVLVGWKIMLGAAKSWPEIMVKTGMHLGL
jgi:hypothetical protein